MEPRPAPHLIPQFVTEVSCDPIPLSTRLKNKLGKDGVGKTCP
jgi:hypothetical protein